MTKRKPSVHKHLAFDHDLFERSEKLAESEDKSLNAWVNDAIRFKIEDIDKTNQVQVSNNNNNNENKEQVDDSKPVLSIERINEIIKYELIPAVYNLGDSARGDKTLITITKSLKELTELTEIKAGKRKWITFETTYVNPLEKQRQEGIERVKAMREKEERTELMKELPNPFETMEIEETAAGKGQTGAETINRVLNTSSTARLDLTYEEYFTIKKQQEGRDKRLAQVELEIKEQAKDSVKEVDESKEIPEDDDKDVSISPTDGNEGVQEDEEPEDET